jgi:hypothetical protein
MAIEDHPLYPAWRAAFDQLVEAERRYYSALMEGASEKDTEVAAGDLDAAREKYRSIAIKVEEYDPSAS